MKVPKNAKGGFSGQLNQAAGNVNAGMKKSTKKKSQKMQGVPGIPDKQSDPTKVHGQPKGTTSMPDSMLNRLRVSKKGL